MKPADFSGVSSYICDMWQDLTEDIRAKLSAIRNALAFAPPWVISAVLLTSAVVVAWLLHAAILAATRRLLHGRRTYMLSVLNATKNPTRLGLLLLALAIALPTTPLGHDTKAVLAQCVALATIC